MVTQTKVKHTEGENSLDGSDAKKVIDADKNIVRKIFHSKDTDKELKYWKSLGKWNDVSIDRDGDIILWEE